MRDDKSNASPLDGAAGTVSQAAQTAGQIQKTVNQARQGAGAAQKAAHTSQAAYAATASAPLHDSQPLDDQRHDQEPGAIWVTIVK